MTSGRSQGPLGGCCSGPGSTGKAPKKEVIMEERWDTYLRYIFEAELTDPENQLTRESVAERRVSSIRQTLVSLCQG